MLNRPFKNKAAENRKKDEAKEKLAKFGALMTDLCRINDDDALTNLAHIAGVLVSSSENYPDWKFAPGIKEAIEELTK